MEMELKVKPHRANMKSNEDSEITTHRVSEELDARNLNL